MKNWRAATVAIMGMVAIHGCASRSANVAATYVSPMEYSGYSCDQIRTRMTSVRRGVMRVSGQQDKAATRDAWATGVGLVLFWPALFFITPSDQSDQLARLKGQYEALEEAAIQNNCDVAEELRVARDRQESGRQQRQLMAPDDQHQSPGSSGYSQTSAILNDQPRSSVPVKPSSDIGESSFLVEGFAKEKGCPLDGPARLISADSSLEIYHQKCLTGSSMVFSCEWGQCTQLR